MPDDVKVSIKTDIQIDYTGLYAKITISGEQMTIFYKEFDLSDNAELRDFLKRLMNIIKG